MYIDIYIDIYCAIPLATATSCSRDMLITHSNTGRRLSRLHSSLIKRWNEIPGLRSYIILLLDKKKNFIDL